MSIQIDMQFDELISEQTLTAGPVRMFVDNLVYDHSYTELQDLQQAQVAACRSFYQDEEPLRTVDMLDLLYDDERTELVINQGNIEEVKLWLRHWTTFAAFKPAIIEDERGLVLVY